MADHVLVVGSDVFQSGIRTFLAMSGAEVPKKKNVTNIQRYVTYLNGLPAAQRPVGTIYIGSHANEDGWLDLDLDDEGRKEAKNTDTDIGELERAKISGSVKLAAATIDNNSEVVLRGCRVGQSQPFLKLFREALGDGIKVYAPRFVDEVATFENTKTKKVISALEWFSYGFEVIRATAFADRAAAVAGFETAALTGFRDLNGAAIPTKRWDEWLIEARSDLWSKPDLKVYRKKSHRVTFGQTVARLTDMDVGVETRHQVVRQAFTATFNSGIASPFSDADLRTEMLVRVAAHPEFDATKTVLPRHFRFGFATVPEFVDGVIWTQHVDAKNKAKLFMTATWHAYVLRPPVVDTTTGNVFFNYVHHPSLTTEPTVNQVLFTDPKFFGSK